MNVDRTHVYTVEHVSTVLETIPVFAPTQHATVIRIVNWVSVVGKTLFSGEIIKLIPGQTHNAIE